MGRINPLVAIGIPTWGTVSTEWSDGYRGLGSPLGSTTVGIKVKNRPIAEARNEIMRQAFETGAEFLFFLGDDVIPPGDTIIRLIHRMWENPDIGLITGVYWTKQWPASPYIWRGMQRGPYLDWVAGEWFEVDYAGCDCLLVRLTPELKALGPTWFSTEWLWEPTQDQPSELSTEDFYFYTLCRKAGIRLWCDTLVQCLHQDRRSGMLFGLVNGMAQAGGSVPALPEPGTEDELAKEQPKTIIADIGCGRDTPHFGPPDKVRVVRFDGDETVRPDYRCDLRRLPVKDGFADVVHARHVLEHFSVAEAPDVVREWGRILRTGGELQICVPFVIGAMRRIIAMTEGTEPMDHYPWWQVYGSQSDHRDFHKNGFSERKLAGLLRQAGCFEDVRVEIQDDGLNLYAFARKAATQRPMALTDEWTEIERREGFVMPGLRRLEPDGIGSRAEETVSAPTRPAEPVAVAESVPAGSARSTPAGTDKAAKPKPRHKANGHADSAVDRALIAAGVE